MTRRVRHLGLPWALVLALLLALGGLLSPGAALALGVPVSPSPQETKDLESIRGKLPGEIVFASRRDGPWRLYRMDADGSHLARLSSLPANERRPYFAQEGKVLFFQSDRGGKTQVWRANPDLSDPKLVSPPGRQEWLHGVSADGSRLLVRTGDQPTDYLLRFLDQGREVPVDFPGWGVRRGWLDAVLSPDGQRLGAQVIPRDGGPVPDGVYVMELDDQGKVHGARKVSDGCMVGWRPDSQAFLTCRRTPGGASLWLAQVDGQRQRLTEGRVWEYFPAFSPDGQYMVWSASPSDQHDHDTGSYELMVRPLAGGQAVRLTFHSAPDEDPAWGPGRHRVSGGQGAQLIYQAVEYNHPPGQVSEDPQALSGRAVLVPAASPGGQVIYGQYDYLPAGSYLARFRLRLAQAVGQGPAVRLDVAAGGGKVLASRQVGPGQLPPGGGYQELDLPFRLEQADKDMEFRVDFIPGVADVWVERVTVSGQDSLGPDAQGLGGYFQGLLRRALGRD